MWPDNNAFYKHVCLVFLSVTLITYFLVIRNNLQFKFNKELIEQLFDNESYFADSLQLIKYDYGEFNTTLDKVGKINIINDNKSEIIYILGLFELSTKWGKRKEGYSEVKAAQLAVDHVNKLQVLPGYRIELLVNDTKCDPGVGIDRFFHALYSNKNILMLLGSGCSNVTERLAHVIPYWNLIQVSFGSTSPSLSDRNKFPLFFRTAAPQSSHNTAKMIFLKEFGWKVVATLSQSENVHLLPLNRLVTQLEQVNISCISTVTFSMDNYKDQLRELKNLNVRIIVASFSTSIASKIFCTAFELEMFGEYVWIIQYQEDFWINNTECQQENLMSALEGLVLFSDYDRATSNETSISGLDSQEFESYLNITKEVLSVYAKQTYDAVWAIALTLREAELTSWIRPLRKFNYKRRDMVYNFRKKMSQLQFFGLSGPVKFMGADRIGNSLIQQIQNGELKNVAVFDSVENELNFNCEFCERIQWKNGKVPVAQRILKITLITIPNILFYTILIICLSGIVSCLLFLYFNLHFRRVRTVKLSSPKINNVAVFGCILVYSSVILLGINNVPLVQNIYFSQICMIRVYLLSAGFSLAFGSMFAKTYRVHRLFTYGGANIIKDKLLKDKQLIGLILTPLLLDGLILILWITIDPMEKHLYNLTLEISSDNPGIVYQPLVETCQSRNTSGWYIALYGYKMLILIMGAYMAWNTRHVKIPGLNDSQYIGICVYTAVFSAIIVVLCHFISNYVILSYLAKTASIITSTTITLFLMFLPKLKSVFGKVDLEDPLMQSMGLKIECNTRRFINHDPKEMIYRLEIQNRVYQCELEALDREILRLEQLLEPKSSCSQKSSVNVIETKADCHKYLTIPTPIFGRASWPSDTNNFVLSNQNKNDFMSENKLNERFLDKFNILGKLKRFFGSIPTISVQQAPDNFDLFKIKVEKRKLHSNPEFYSQIQLPKSENIQKAKSELCIVNTK